MLCKCCGNDSGRQVHPPLIDSDDTVYAVLCSGCELMIENESTTRRNDPLAVAADEVLGDDVDAIQSLLEDEVALT